MTASPPKPGVWLGCTLALSVVLLAVVHGFERFGGYPPCELCLRQREWWWAAGWASLAGLAAMRWRPSLGWLFCAAVGVLCLVGAGVAAYHAGVEWKWWPGPTACTGRLGRAVTGADVAAALSGQVKVHLVRCDEAALRWFGLSMAGWNALVSLAAGAASLAVAIRHRRSA